MDLTLEAVSTE
jgi:hypothetical protein